MSEIRKVLEEKFPQFDKELIDTIAERGTLRHFHPGDVILQQGQPLKSTMLITKGLIKLVAEGDEGEEYFMYYLEPGQACALSFVCSEKSRKIDLDAVVKEETEVIQLPVELMDELMIKNKSWYYFVMDNYRSRFRELLDVIRSVAFHNMDERLEYYLLRQKNSSGSSTIHLTHEQIATDLNSSRVLISSLLKQLEQKRKVKLHRFSLEIL